MAWLWMAVGLVVLTAGAEFLVRGASALALAMRISPLVVGLTVVAYGTSAPELVVSVQSSLLGQQDVALGNVVGSNIFNILLILGLSAVITPLAVAHQLIRFDVPLMIGLSVLVYLFGLNGRIDQWEGVLFALGMISYSAFAVIKSRQEQNGVRAEYEQEFGKWRPKGPLQIFLQLLLLLAGLGLLILGARLFLDSAVEIARAFGISELVIGLTLVAMGTSLPEVATSVVAAIKGERDIAVGNVVGSNLFNIMGVLGLSATFSSNGVTVAPTAMQFDIPIMVAVAFASLPIFFTGYQISRWEGALFLLYWTAYTSYLILFTELPEVARLESTAVVYGILPATILLIAVSTARSIQQQQSNSAS